MASSLVLSTHHPSCCHTPRLQLRKSANLIASFSPPVLRLRSIHRLHVTAPTTPTDASLNDDFVEEEQEQEQEHEQEHEHGSSSSFSWRDHWYPVSLVEDLDPSVPTPFQLLNRDLVLWKDPSTAQWVAFDDRCPHRLAPLSEGRVDENGWLQCSYHGWSFDGDGSCRRIPQASSEGPEARAAVSPRACAVKLPTMISQGLLFVWPDENGWEKAASAQPPMLPDEFNDPNFSIATIQRDLSYGYDTLLENASDPSHLDFAHHKVLGRRDRSKPFPLKMEASGAWGFDSSAEGNPRFSYKFVAPCHVINKTEIDIKLPLFGEQKWVSWFCILIIPMAPGKSRSILCSAQNFVQFTVSGQVWWQVLPRWYRHWIFNMVYDGDMIVLQGQEKVFLSKSMGDTADVNQQYTKITFTPTQADRLVLAVRNWLRRYGNSQPYWFGTVSQQSMPSAVLTKRQMMDRYEQHTVKCSSCKSAYTAFQSWEKVLIGATVILCAAVGLPQELGLRLPLAAAAIFNAAMAYLLHELQKEFVFVDYVHANID